MRRCCRGGIETEYEKKWHHGQFGVNYYRFVKEVVNNNEQFNGQFS